MTKKTTKKITIGSLFSGIGGFELGLERAIPNSETIWQCEQNAFCQKVLKKHWPNIPIYNDIKEIKHGAIDIVDIICGGFPCQDISNAGKGKGIALGDKSSLWFQMLRIIDIIRPRIAVIENVTAITCKGRGMDIVLSSLAQIGYDVEWIDVRASDEGAPHKRERIFFVAYSNCTPTKNAIQTRREIFTLCNATTKQITSNTNMQHIQKQSMHTISMETKSLLKCRSVKDLRIQSKNYWEKTPIESPLCRVDDGIPNRVDRIRALGNAIVPQCSERIGDFIMKSGILDDIEEYRKIQKEMSEIPW